jgi:hypothetical protein
VNFALTNGVNFQSPGATEAIVPELLRTVWEEHQPQGKEAVLWELMQQGSVSGDCFIKVAFEDGYDDPAGNMHPPKIRILPLNSAFCFPEYHPHDMTRMIRFKMKYRFWGTALEGTRQVFSFCVDDKTEALTREGWKSRTELTTADEVLALDPVFDEIRWEPVLAVNEFDWDAPLIRWQNRGIDALTTPNHRWITQDWRARDSRYVAQSEGHVFKTTEEFHCGQGRETIIAGGGTPLAFAEVSKWSDDFVELAAWVITEGSYRHTKLNESTIVVSQSLAENAEFCARIRRLQSVFVADGANFREKWFPSRPRMLQWFISGDFAREIRDVLPDKQITPAFLCSLTFAQAKLFYETLLDGDGHRKSASGGRGRPTELWAQKDQGRIDGFQMLCAMLGRRTNARKKLDYYHSIKEVTADSTSEVTVLHSRNLRVKTIQSSEEHYTGKVWCPSVSTKTWLARRNGVTYWTGNTELWTEDAMQAFINDELVESQENPLGMIPFVHIANKKVPSSPWGLGDCQDINDLNRNYNEIATLLTDIVNYYASPTTVIIGAKSNALERGAKKVWSIPTKDASITNLSLGAELEQSITFLELLKEKMHELVGIPVNALGQPQEISNTSGVALSLQFLPLVQKFKQKTTQYKAGLQMLNEIIIRTAALYMPELLEINPERDPPLQEGQLEVLDPRDPLSYRNTVEFASPLPIDKLIALNEIQMEMGLGLESKTGALKKLGEAYPAEKLEELLNELHQDMLEQGALDLLRAQMTVLISMLTGLPPDGAEGGDTAAGQTPAGGVASAGGPGVNTASGVQPTTPPIANDPGIQDLMQRINTISQGTKIPQVRNPLKSGDD